MILRNRPYLVGFLIGLAIFTIPVYMLVVPRGPCVETTDFHMEPDTVKPGEKFFAVWTAKTLRECSGELNRRFVDENGIDVWVFPISHIVENGLPGEAHRFHTPWIAPVAFLPTSPPTGASAFSKRERRTSFGTRAPPT